MTFTRSSVDTGWWERKRCSQPHCTKSPLTHSKFVPNTQGEKTLGLRKTLESINYGVSTTGGINHYLGGLTHKPVSEHRKDKNPEGTYALPSSQTRLRVWLSICHIWHESIANSPLCQNKKMVSNTIAPTILLLHQKDSCRKFSSCRTAREQLQQSVIDYWCQTDGRKDRKWDWKQKGGCTLQMTEGESWENWRVRWKNSLYWVHF